MANRILQDAAVSAVANPVDTFAAPRIKQDGWGQLAESLSSINPKLQGIIQTQYKRNAQSDEAAGVVAADSISSSLALNKNKQGWKGLVDSVRKEDEVNGTDFATRLVGTSPHFQRGLVKAKAQRVGMGLSSHLQRLWEQDDGGVKSIDDPNQLRAWMQERTQAYSEKAGVQDIDPLIAAETYSPYIGQTQEKLLSGHMTYRAKARVAAFGNEFQANVGLIASGASTGASSVEDFIGRMTQSESGGNSSVINDLGYGGWLQFGQDRLDDYNRVAGTNITVREFAQNEELQKRINVWHINDIDKTIQESGYLSQGYSLDGLRAVAHLGGQGGMHEFVRRAGTDDPYDPDDGYTNKKGKRVKGTKLSDYYKKFSGSGAALKAQADEAIANGLAPKAVNEMLVDSIVAQAEITQNPSLLDLLDDVDTGSGPLGNISWVKEKRIKAAERIDDEMWETSERQRTLEDRALADRRKEMTAEGFQIIMDDPYGDHSELFKQATNEGFGELARSFYNLQEQVKNAENNVETDHNTVIMLRNEIRKVSKDNEESVANMIVEGVQTGLYPSSVGVSLMDDLRTGSNGNGPDYLRDSGVRNWVDNYTSEIKEALTQKDFITGEVLVSGMAIANQFEEEISDEILAYISDNPDVSVEKVRLFTRKKARELRNLPEYQKPEEPSLQGGSSDTELDSVQSSATSTSTVDPVTNYTEAQIEALALQKGISVDAVKDIVRAGAGYIAP